MSEEINLETLLAHFGEERENYHGAVVPPIFQNSLFTFENWDAIDAAFEDRLNNYIYTRGKNPTVNLAEQKIAKLADGESAKLFGSGMAAISAALLHFLEPEDNVIASKNIYGPANNLLNVYLRRKMKIETTFVDGREVENFASAINKKTKVIYLESPSTGDFSLQDIEAIADLAKAHKIRTILDNTWATPIFQKPLELGVDLEVHSCSKYICGHSDVVAGVVIGSKGDISEISLNEFELLGGKMAPFEAWLITRSLRTLPMRMKMHQENAQTVAKFLQNHPRVRKVNYPGLENFPQRELAKKQMSGFSGLFSFELDTDKLEQVKRFFDNLEIIQIGVKLGRTRKLDLCFSNKLLKRTSRGAV